MWWFILSQHCCARVGDNLAWVSDTFQHHFFLLGPCNIDNEGNPTFFSCLIIFGMTDKHGTIKDNQTVICWI